MDDDDLFGVFAEDGGSKTTPVAYSSSKRGREESGSPPVKNGTVSQPGVEAAGDEESMKKKKRKENKLKREKKRKLKKKMMKEELEADAKMDGEATRKELQNPNNRLNGFSKSPSPSVVVPPPPVNGQSPGSSRESSPVEQLPVVADTFETEASRKVVASSGLQGKSATAEEGAEDGQITLSHQVRHQVALPPAFPYVPIAQHQPVEPPARVWPFTLDPFQKVSIHSIERNESVLVSAHTSAGKTVVAEYAIAQSLRDKQRVIYTSPIKALSNQKYRELLKEFGDVGLMTGDVTINPSASCIVMTTEILRSMLYRGSEVMREVAWVIFDEIHYMRDKERGVVWEETIILLPRKVHYVFLSATIPNAMQFAEWICKTKEQPCHVVYTDFRPTPLQHYLFPAGGDGIHLVVDEKGIFREDNFQKAMSSLLDAGGDDPSSPIARGKKGETKKGGAVKGTSDIYKIVKMIMVKKYNPVIVFAFSKRECERLALQMSKMDFNDEDERNMVGLIFENAVRQLSDDDRQLPQIAHIQPLLKRGIGIHHSGLLPILKEVIEILFQEGLIKVLFATETFSIGLNMPARTVVFTSVRKFDGKTFRPLSSGEYIQMSGRAGRRGLDDRGIVIMMLDEKMEPQVAKEMVKGEADPLNSAFHLGYNMILNLLRVEGISPEYMLERCFYQFQSTTSLPVLEKSQRDAQKRLAQMKIDREEFISDYYELRSQLDILTKDLKDVICHPTYSLPFMQSGRLVKVKHDGQDFGWGAVVSHYKRTPAKGKSIDASLTDPNQSANAHVVDVLLDCAKGGRTSGPKASMVLKAAEKGQPSEMVVIPVLLSTLDAISKVRLYLPKDLKSLDAREAVRGSIKQVLKKFGDDIEHLDPITDMGIHDEKFKTLIRKIELLEDRLKENEIANDPDLERLFNAYSDKMAIRQAITEYGRKIDEAQSVIHLDELKNRKRVLRRLGFSKQDDVIEIKGRVACEVSSGDELLLTELIFSGVFSELNVEQTVGLCSCFILDEKSEVQTKLKEDLAEPLRKMQESARAIAKVARECKLPLIEEEYVQSFKPELMDVFYAWAKGARFSQICKMTDVFEGSLIRCFRRSEELLRSLSEAASVMGNEELSKKFEQGIEVIKRDVVFAGSLYL